jgi:Ca2+-binding RTX toxin-like protein
MRTARVLLTLSVLVVPVATAAPAAAYPPRVPQDCAVPPDIDLSQFNVIIGTNGPDVLRGTARADFICARLGNDVVYAGGGSDLILGDTTTFFGNVNAAGGGDTIWAGAGDDEVLSGPGNDRVFGEDGADFLALAVGNDTGIGGAGDDSINGGFGRDTIDAGPGNDFAAGGFDADVLNGGPGRDALFGELPPDSPPPPPGVPIPGPARDVCNGGTGVDSGLDCDVRSSIEAVV